MQKITFSRKAALGAAAVGTLLLLLLLISVSRETSIGQTYKCVELDGQVVGYVPADVDVKAIFCAARRELALETDKKLCMDYDWNADTVRKPFVELMQEEELKDALKEALNHKVLSTGEQVYTVAIEDYRGNFTSLQEVETFLNKVKDRIEGGNLYTTTFHDDASHVSGLMCAQLTEKDAKGERALQDDGVSGTDMGVTAGACTVAVEQLGRQEDVADSYRTGVLDMKFVEHVEIYENYVPADNIDSVDEEVIEVTKEKESNKIYVVESGDCLSVIALDNNTTVASIMALNGMESADAIIRDGQELIIAVPEPDLKIRVTMGEVYEEDYAADPVIIENDSWYTTKEVVLEEETTGHRERNDVVVYENGVEVSRDMVQQKVMTASKAAVIERGTIIPPTYIKPIAGGRFTSGFGRRWGRMHKGVDWACPVGTTVYASCGGTVIQASYNGGYGNNVVISHPDGRMTRYAHNSKLLVKVGQKVEQGEPIALSGNTGRSTGPHVHFEIYINGVAVNPLKYISN